MNYLSLLTKREWKAMHIVFLQFYLMKMSGKLSRYDLG
jgi:hypothetical protein